MDEMFRVTSNKFKFGKERKASHIQTIVRGRKELHNFIDNVLGKYDHIEYLKFRVIKEDH